MAREYVDTPGVGMQGKIIKEPSGFTDNTAAIAASANAANAANAAFRNEQSARTEMQGQVGSARERLEAGLEKAYGIFDAALAGGEKMIADTPFPITQADAERPFTDMFSKMEASMLNSRKIEAERANEQVDAFIQGSRDARPWAKYAAVRDAQSEISRNYSQGILALNDTFAKSVTQVRMQWAGAKSQHDLGLLSAANQKLGVAAQYAASIAGVNANIFGTEIGLAEGVYQTRVNSGTQLATANMNSATQLAVTQLGIAGDKWRTLTTLAAEANKQQNQFNFETFQNQWAESFQREMNAQTLSEQQYASDAARSEQRRQNLLTFSQYGLPTNY
jgi:hypothetical protein